MKLVNKKKNANEEFGRKMNVNIYENKKLFWKEVRKCKKENGGGKKKSENIRDERGRIFIN